VLNSGGRKRERERERERGGVNGCMHVVVLELIIIVIICHYK